MKKSKKQATLISGISLNKLSFVSNSQEKYIRGKISRIAENLKDLRIQVNLSQEELAELSSVSVSSIKSIEQNQRTPSIPMLLRILFVIDQNLKGKVRPSII